MNCPYCDSTANRQLSARTSLGYLTFRCSTCFRRFNERTGTRYNHLQFPTDIVLLVVLWRLRYKLSLRDLAEMFLVSGFEFTHEIVRDWERRFAVVLQQYQGVPHLASRAVVRAIDIVDLGVQDRLLQHNLPNFAFSNWCPAHEPTQTVQVVP